MMNVHAMYKHLKLVLLMILVSGVFNMPFFTEVAADQVPSVPEPTEAARKVANAIRKEVELPPLGPSGRPLPLASHWNVGSVAGTFEPAHQIELLQQGIPILPWMSEPTGDPSRERFQEYYGPLLDYLSELGLPFSMRGTQWEAMLYGGEYRDQPDDRWAGVITPDGQRMNVLCPFGPVAMWREPAARYVDTDAMRWVQERYPDPPLVIWFGNNEARDLRWHQLDDCSRYLEKYGEDRSAAWKRRVVGEGWTERYSEMFDAMREAMAEASWRENVRFIGYGAFGPSPLGRWGGWKRYSLHTEEAMAWEWDAWDGSSPSYYTHNWNANRDHWVWSTQVQSMNWLFMLDQAFQANPAFWFEISTWDGNTGQGYPGWLKVLGIEDQPEKLAEQASRPLDDEQIARLHQVANQLPGRPLAKALTYMGDGQTYCPDRARGWLQFGMWLLRPRVVREYRCHTTPLEPFKPYWMQVVKSVARVWESETLEEFWRFGELVPNPNADHPYQSNMPDYLRGVDRWYLLDTDLDPERPWGLRTEIPVFALALVLREEAPALDRSPAMHRWLVYAHSPLEDRQRVRIRIPGYYDESIEVDVPVEGAFYILDEESGEVVEATFGGQLRFGSLRARAWYAWWSKRSFASCPRRMAENCGISKPRPAAEPIGPMRARWDIFGMTGGCGSVARESGRRAVPAKRTVRLCQRLLDQSLDQRSAGFAHAPDVLDLGGQRRRITGLCRPNGVCLPNRCRTQHASRAVASPWRAHRAAGIPRRRTGRNRMGHGPGFPGGSHGVDRGQLVPCGTGRSGRTGGSRCPVRPEARRRRRTATLGSARRAGAGRTGRGRRPAGGRVEEWPGAVFATALEAIQWRGQATSEIAL